MEQIYTKKYLIPNEYDFPPDIIEKLFNSRKQK
jgi:hypothetical protein